VLTKYINSSDWNPEKINFSSKAAGPLALWTTSQIKFADIEKKVEPLKNEVAKLKKEGEEQIKKKEFLDKNISELIE